MPDALIDALAEDLTEVFEGGFTGGASVARTAKQAGDAITSLNQLAAQTSDWYGGAANGGPNGDGLFPLTDAVGVTRMVPSPAKVAQMINQRGVDVSSKGILLNGASQAPTLLQQIIDANEPVFFPAGRVSTTSRVDFKDGITLIGVPGRKSILEGSFAGDTYLIGIPNNLFKNTALNEMVFARKATGGTGIQDGSNSNFNANGTPFVGDPKTNLNPLRGPAGGGFRGKLEDARWNNVTIGPLFAYEDHIGFNPGQTKKYGAIGMLASSERGIFNGITILKQPLGTGCGGWRVSGSDNLYANFRVEGAGDDALAFTLGEGTSDTANTLFGTTNNNLVVNSYFYSTKARALNCGIGKQSAYDYISNLTILNTYFGSQAGKVLKFASDSGKTFKGTFYARNNGVGYMIWNSLGRNGATPYNTPAQLNGKIDYAVLLSTGITGATYEGDTIAPDAQVDQSTGGQDDFTLTLVDAPNRIYRLAMPGSVSNTNRYFTNKLSGLNDHVGWGAFVLENLPSGVGGSKRVFRLTAITTHYIEGQLLHHDDDALTGAVTAIGAAALGVTLTGVACHTRGFCTFPLAGLDAGRWAPAAAGVVKVAAATERLYPSKCLNVRLEQVLIDHRYEISNNPGNGTDSPAITINGPNEGLYIQGRMVGQSIRGFSMMNGGTSETHLDLTAQYQSFYDVPYFEFGSCFNSSVKYAGPLPPTEPLFDINTKNYDDGEGEAPDTLIVTDNTKTARNLRLTPNVFVPTAAGALQTKAAILRAIHGQNVVIDGGSMRPKSGSTTWRRLIELLPTVKSLIIRNVDLSEWAFLGAKLTDLISFSGTTKVILRNVEGYFDTPMPVQLVTNANAVYAQATGALHMSTGASDRTVTLPTDAQAGQLVEIKKIDSGAGRVILPGSLGRLDQQNDIVGVRWSGTAWEMAYCTIAERRVSYSTTSTVETLNPLRREAIVLVTSGASDVTMTHPTSPVEGDRVTYVKADAGAGRVILNSAATGWLNAQNDRVVFRYRSGAWVVVEQELADKVQLFTANGSYTKNPLAKQIYVLVVGGGGGGGSGRRGAAGATRTGGAGGAGGGSQEALFHSSMLPTTAINLTVGAAGVGGAAAAADSTNGNAGTDGGLSRFGALTDAWCLNGAGGTGGNPGSNGAVNNSVSASQGRTAGIGGGTSGTASSNATAGFTGAGGGGGVLSSANAATSGARGTLWNGTTTTPAAVGANGPAGTAPPGMATMLTSSSGGGGGGAGPADGSAPGGTGGAAAGYGGGGGGGGASVNGQPSGAGGNGTGGAILVHEHF